MKSLFIYNPESGKGKLVKYEKYIIDELSKKFGEIDVVRTTHQGHASELARDSVNNYDYLFVSGGDGTLNEIVNGLGESENKPIVGYIPSGTVNDIARSLNISKNIKKAVKNIVNGEPFLYDIFKVNNRYGIYVCCAGLFTSSSYMTKRQNKKAFGKIAYFFNGAKDVFKTKPIEIKIETDDEVIEKNCAMFLIINSRSVAGIKLNKGAELDDGKVEVVLFHSHKNKLHLCEITRCLNAFCFGLKSVISSKHITYRKLNHFKITAKEGTVINLDGEKSGSGSFTFTVINKGLQIIVPKKGKNGKESKN